MYRPTKDEIAAILAAHVKWVRGDADGKRANLSGANLNGANLNGADLNGADLNGADLRSADLRSADLRSANLRSANLSGANLSGADLRSANLTSANLTSANLRSAYLPDFQLPAGTLIGWKKLRNGVLARLEIPAKAKRTATPVGRKCRAEYVKVLELIGLPQDEKSGRDQHSGKTVYRVGRIVRPDSYDDDIRVECTHGIHFFATRKEAEEY